MRFSNNVSAHGGALANVEMSRVGQDILEISVVRSPARYAKFLRSSRGCNLLSIRHACEASFDHPGLNVVAK